jgi:hypothetical protein
MIDGFKKFIEASERDRRDLFLSASTRVGTAIQNVEKDFWVCWVLEVLYHGLPKGSPRLLFKGGTSLSKAYGLIRRFSEDIDITVFREDLKEPASVEALEGLSGKKRKAKLDAIRDACRSWVTGALQEHLSERLKELAAAGHITVDKDDSDGQTLLVWYPTVAADGSGYVRPAVRIECGAKSALDPHREALVRPYIADEAKELDLTTKGVITIEAARTFWDKVVVAHGLRRWYEIRGELRQEGQRVSRHYYDLHCLHDSEAGGAALDNRGLGADCVRHARMFFDRPDFDLASAKPGTWAIAPAAAMRKALERDYANTVPMIFGSAPSFEEIMESVRKIDVAANTKP